MKPGSFLPDILLKRDREKPWTEWITGSVLFSDVSGFTPMSEALSSLGAEGAEILTDILNRYFAFMIGIIHAHGGQVMKFGGDAILCFFPDESPVAGGGRPVAGETDGHSSTRNPQLSTRNSPVTSLPCALRAARLMQEGMTRFQSIRTPVKKFALRMKIGIAHGECLLAGVGDPAVRCDYVFAGEPVDLTADAEHHAAAGEIILADSESGVRSSGWKAEELDEGFFRVLSVPEAPSSECPSPLSTLNPPPSTSPSAYGDPPSTPRSYMIAEVHDLVASGHVSQVGALLEIVPVFLKFTGFTYSREGFDLPLFDAFFRTLMEVTERHGGRLNRISMGDKGSTAFLLFGAPNPLEKKEQLASQWALDLAAVLRGRFPRLNAGVGMNSGRAFCGIVGGADRREYTVMGDAVNFAARLMQGAESGQACVSEPFAQRAREVYRFDDHGKRKFKGKAEPLAVYALKERRRAGWTTGGTEPSVGREKETEGLLGLLDAASNGAPGMAVIVGEPGVGKSFLSSRILREAHQRGWRTVPAKGEITRRSHAYAPWRDLFSDLLFHDAPPDTEILDPCLEEDDRPCRSWFLEFFGLPAAEDPEVPACDEETRKRLFQHRLALLLLRQAREGPLFLFLDDLHWFDTLSLELLASLLNHLKDHRIFILTASRPEWEKKDFENRATVHFFSLADLDRDDCRTLAEGRLGGKVRDDLTAFLYERARGNPFFTHQLLDYLLNEDLLETRLGEWLLKRGVEQKGVLSGTEILLAQINRLPAVEQAHIRAASCIGPSFALAVLEKVMGSAFRKTAMNGLLDRGYILHLEDDIWSFPHALVQETVYQAMPQRLRKQIHRRIGSTLEGMFAGRLEPIYPNLGNHYHLADSKDKAFTFCTLAGEALFKKLSFPESQQFFEKAFGAANSFRKMDKLGAGLRLAQAEIKTGRFNECLALSKRLRESARRSGDTQALHRLSALQFEAMEKLGKYGYVPKALRLLKTGRIRQTDLRTMIMNLVAIGYFRMGKFSKADDFFLKIIHTGGASDATEHHLSSLVYLASIESKRDNVDQATSYLRQGLDLARQTGNAYQEIRLKHEYAVVLMGNKKYEDARAKMTELLPLVESYGDYYLTAVIYLNSGLIDTWMNRWADASKELEEAARIFLSIGVLNGFAKSQMNLGILAFYQADYKKAYDYYHEGTRALEKTNEMNEVCHGYFNLSEACVKLGLKRDAEEWYEKGIHSFYKEDSPKLHQMFQDLEKQIKLLN